MYSYSTEIFGELPTPKKAVSYWLLAIGKTRKKTCYSLLRANSEQLIAKCTFYASFHFPQCFSTFLIVASSSINEIISAASLQNYHRTDTRFDQAHLMLGTFERIDTSTVLPQVTGIPQIPSTINAYRSRNVSHAARQNSPNKLRS